MPSLRFTTRFCGAAIVAGAIIGLVCGGIATPHPDTESAFRRPAQLAGAPFAQDDAIWTLGQRLFFDPALSNSGKTSCATCHDSAKAWSNSSPKAIGDTGHALAFKAPTLLDVGLLDRLGWTGRFSDTAAVSLFAMTSPATMNMPLQDLLVRLSADPSYVATFQNAFAGQGLTRDTIGVALTRFVDSITAARSPFDAWIDGNANAIGQDAKRGFAVFTGKARCNECHSSWTFTDGSFHDVGTAQTDRGRGQYFGSSVELQHAFKTPTLRSVAERAPYMHDGSEATLDDVIDLYDRGGIDRPSRAGAIRPLHLSAQEKQDLKAFLQTLSAGTDFVVRP